MTMQPDIKLFESRQVRTAWDDAQEKWFFSIVDVCAVLTEQTDYDRAKNYWKVLKFRLIKEGNELVTKCNQLKMISPKDGKRYNTDVADPEQVFRIIQSIPSRKAEPFKQWMAQVAAADGGDIARNARLELEAQTGKPVISPMNAKNLLQTEIFPQQLEATSPTPPPHKRHCTRKNRD